ncbi:hypothetical protein UPYG_G00092410 [Umbra pygmaea]|uniref:CBM21 domain-containing protein n=1 Tax=Umbra pygmaea TaxID=75934 RepID=A0ABD0XJD3_UMBPY
MMRSSASVRCTPALCPGADVKETERTSSHGNDRLTTVSLGIAGKPRAVSPCMIGGRRAPSPGRPGRSAPSAVGTDRSSSLTELQDSLCSKPTVKTLRLGSILDTNPEPTKVPVRIRPPSLLPPHPKEPPDRSLSSDAPTRPVMRRRTRSLPSASETQRNRQVRFIDSLGLELEDVKVFRKGEEPQIPIHVFTRLLMSSEMNSGRPLELSLPYFKPCFPEKRGCQTGFVQCLVRQAVALDQVQCSEMGITGTVQVLNLAYLKEVAVRYSFTNWRSSAETQACWVTTLRRDQADGPEADVFHFRLPVPPFILQPGAMLEFAVRYRVEGAEYWDNNGGCNYKLSCHSYKHTVPRECEDSMVHYT